MTIEARLERLERALGLSATGETADVPPKTARRGNALPADAGLNDWLASLHSPGQIRVAIGVVRDRARASAMRSWREGETRFDLPAVAGLCQALANEARLAILRELTLGTRASGELMAAAGIDRGQLYHHLRDLLLQGLVRQPERGRYAGTSRGEMAFFAATVLPQLGNPKDREHAALPPEFDGDEGATTEQP